MPYFRCGLSVTLSSKFDLQVQNYFKTLPIMYWLPKMHQTRTGARFILVSRKCSTIALSRAVTKTFKLIFTQIQSFHEKSHFYYSYKNFWVLEKSMPVIDRLDQVTTKQNAKRISTFHFRTLYTKLSHKDLQRPVLFRTNCSRMNQVKFVEDSL